MVIVEEMDLVTRFQILDETLCISHSTNSLEKGKHSIILPSVGQIWLFNLDIATGLGDEKLN